MFSEMKDIKFIYGLWGCGRKPGCLVRHIDARHAAPMAGTINLPPSTLSTVPLTSSFISRTHSFSNFTRSFNLRTTFKPPSYHSKRLSPPDISLSLNPIPGDSASSHQNRWSLHGKTALVTGGTRGIGYATILSQISTYICTRFFSFFRLWSLN